MTDPVRLSKRLAELLPCSRREAELYIEGGWVSVDGAVVEEPQFKVEAQRIELLPGATATPLEPVSILLNKPAGHAASLEAILPLLTPENRWPEDRSGIRPLKRHLSTLKAVSELEPDASGLLVFSQNYSVSRKLLEDAHKLEHEYTVDVTGTLAADGLAALQHGMRYRGHVLSPCKVSWQSEQRLRFALKTPQPGQLRFMCESVGLRVLGLRRLRIGRVAMSKLQPGQWRYLGADERF
ncbi:RNA pseudouridine synthase [Pseudomonas sp. RIT-PI-AD]|uniref:RNA pseudouridine synthase n=1 Tax=Pseudomonas sp. RIT-PI-AD TaxID=3035294 RepID=UPI0021D9726A|nr:RNA pseudouridine synthase [Pseudomonas sp. RIT-PI-AD]